MGTKFCIFNRLSISQAGRRGFDPRLPIHVFQSLPGNLESALVRFGPLTSLPGRSRPADDSVCRNHFDHL